jgi:hypothetical protein
MGMLMLMLMLMACNMFSSIGNQRMLRCAECRKPLLLVLIILCRRGN